MHLPPVMGRGVRLNGIFDPFVYANNNKLVKLVDLSKGSRRSSLVCGCWGVAHEFGQKRQVRKEGNKKTSSARDWREDCRPFVCK